MHKLSDSSAYTLFGLVYFVDQGKLEGGPFESKKGVQAFRIRGNPGKYGRMNKPCFL